jgi:hypothetical protein
VGGAGQEGGVGIGGTVPGQGEKDLLDYSMDSEEGSGSDKDKEVDGDESILDTAGEEESMDTAAGRTSRRSRKSMSVSMQVSWGTLTRTSS